MREFAKGIVGRNNTFTNSKTWLSDIHLRDSHLGKGSAESISLELLRFVRQKESVGKRQILGRHGTQKIYFARTVVWVVEGPVVELDPVRGGHGGQESGRIHLI